MQLPCEYNGFKPVGFQYWRQTVLVGFLICLRFFFLSWVWVHHPESLTTPDSASYEQTALALLHSHAFLSSVLPDAKPETERTPGYPLFIAVVYGLTRSSRLCLLLLQVILSGAIAVLIMLICNLSDKKLNRHAGYIAVLLYFFDINSHIYSIMVITETFFSIFILLFVYALLKALSDNRGRNIRIFLASTFISFATLVRPVAYYLAPLPGVVLFVLLVFKNRFKRAFQILALWFLPWIVLIGGWQLRNELVANYSGFCSIQATNLLYYRAAGVLALEKSISLGVAQRQLKLDMDAHAFPSLRERDKHAKDMAISILLTHPRLVLYSALGGLKHMLLYADDSTIYPMLFGIQNHDDPYGDFETMGLQQYMEKWAGSLTSKFLYACYNELHLLIIYLGALIGFIMALRSKKIHQRKWAYVVGFTALYFILISAGPEAYTRFRIPIMPLLDCLAGYGLIGLIPFKDKVAI